VATSLLAGPCAIESEEMAMQIAEKLIGITDKLKTLRFKGLLKNKSFEN
jgi:2-dehydro-3-deoxyphosphooctonate aldolase (KDO 8-P synthase)